MAIHVRHKREVLVRMRNRLLAIALSFSICVVFFGGVILWFVIVWHGAENINSFTSVPYESNFDDSLANKPLPQSSSSSSKSSPSSSVTPSLIVADAVASVAMSEMDFSDSMSLGGEGDMDLGGFSLGIGDGLGSGNGNGNGNGDGNGKGGGRHGVGLNNDIQIVLALDASGSMDFLFKEVSASMEQMIKTLQRSTVNGRKASVNVGVMAYGAARDNGAPFKLTDFTTNFAKAREELDKVACDGADERCGEAITYAVENYPWNRRAGNSALKVLIVAGDESFSQGDVDYRQAISGLIGSDIILNTVFCGGQGNPDDEGWTDAANRGHGIRMLMDRDDSESGKSVEQSDKALASALRRLAAVPCMPMGGPIEQKAREEEYNKMKRAIPSKDEQLVDWYYNDGEWMTKGFVWDAVELCRLLGNECTIEQMGGRGNLPESLRGLSEEEALRRLREAASKRAQALKDVSNARNSAGDLCSQLLRAIRTQARKRGIQVRI